MKNIQKPPLRQKERHWKHTPMCLLSTPKRYLQPMNIVSSSEQSRKQNNRSVLAVIFILKKRKEDDYVGRRKKNRIQIC